MKPSRCLCLKPPFRIEIITVCNFIYICRFGRKKAVLLALTVEFFVCIAKFFIPIYELYAVARFLVGTCTGGCFTGIFVMCEYSSSSLV